MPTVPLLKPGEVVKTFEELGWEVVRQRGSHIILTTCIRNYLNHPKRGKIAIIKIQKQ